MDSLFCQHGKEFKPAFRLLWHQHAPLKPWQCGSAATEGHSLWNNGGKKWNSNADSSVCRTELLWWSGLSYLYRFSYQSSHLRPTLSWCFLSPAMWCIYGRLLSVYLDTRRWIGPWKRRVLIRLSPHISALSPSAPEPASVAVATHGLKGYFSFKGQTTAGKLGERGRNDSSYQLTPPV